MKIGSGSSAQIATQAAEELDFADIYQRHWQELCAIAARITRDKAVAQDLVQEVFLSFLRKEDKAQITNIHGYLIQAMKYQCFNWVRNARISKEHLNRMDKAFAENTTENHVDALFIYKELQDVITTMPERCQQVFELSRFRHLNNEEIAAQLNINQRTVENHLTRALKILRLSLKTLFTIIFFY